MVVAFVPYSVKPRPFVVPSTHETGDAIEPDTGAMLSAPFVRWVDIKVVAVLCIGMYDRIIVGQFAKYHDVDKNGQSARHV